METEFVIKDIVKDNTVTFKFYKNNELFYGTFYKGKQYVFPVPIEDVGTATLLNTDKAMLFMRWIRKAIDNQLFVPYTQD